MKKLIISILIPSFLLSLCGCYSMQEVSKDEFIKLDSSHEIIKPDPELETCMITNDSTTYKLDEFSYNDNHDTITILQGAISIKKLWKGAKWEVKETLIPFSGKIAIVDVKKFEAKAKDEPSNSVLAGAVSIGSVVGVAFVFAFMIGMYQLIY